MEGRVYIETDDCVGCESCVELCPEIFDFDDEEQKAYVIMPKGGDELCIEEAMVSCPGECIYLEEF